MINWTRVNELRLEIGGESFAEVVELFLDEVEEVVMRLPAAARAATLEMDLHFLKGSAWNLGFADFGALCQETERRIARGHAAGEEAAAIVDCYGRSKQVFLSGLREIAAGRAPSAA